MMMLRLLIAGLIFGLLTGPAFAKLGTGTPRIWLGQKMAYGAAIETFALCERTHGIAACDEPLEGAVAAVNEWNHCLDGILLDHKINLRWADIGDAAKYVWQMHFRAQIAEDLLWQGGYINRLVETCLPGQNIVIPY
jgi:hypothetical protein